MNTRHVIGQRITAVNHDRWYNHYTQRMESTVRSIELENGVKLIPSGIPTEDETVGTISASETHRKRRARRGPCPEQQNVDEAYREHQDIR